MREPELHCPRCGRKLYYDPAMDGWACPGSDCGLVLRTVAGDRGADSSAGGRERRPPYEGGGVYDWEEERPRHVWRLFAGIVVLLTVAALVAMTLSPLLWPQRTALQLSPTHLSFVDDAGAGAMPQALAIRHQGRGTLEWEAWSDAAWLIVEPGSGTLESGLQIITVRVDMMAVPVGTHSTVLTVVADGAYNSPQTVRVQTLRTSHVEAGTLDLIGPDVEVFHDVQPPYVSSPLGVAVELVNADSAVDVTWDELVDFLVEDPTDESPYIKDLHMCGAFAQQLHNNAEEAGIRAAWVSVDLHGREIGHALNAFQTLDRGLVFIDCTGEDARVIAPGSGTGLCDHDKVAYVKIGKEYGLIALDRAESPAYEFYEEYSRSWDDYLSQLDEFNARAREYNEFVSGRSLVAGSEDARHAQWLYNELESTRVELEMQRELLGSCRWNTLGIVDKVRIYW